MTAALTEQVANEIFDVLVAHAGQRDDRDDRHEFVHHQTERFTSEFRFMGALGFGGKFRRNATRLNAIYRIEGKDMWGEAWYVDAYPEHLTSERLARIEATNAALKPIRDRFFKEGT